MKVEGYPLQVIAGVISDFLRFPSLVVKRGVVLLSVRSEQILLSEPRALPYAVHMEEIKVRHGAKCKKWGACFDTLCFRSNTQRSQYFGKKAGKFCGAC